MYGHREWQVTVGMYNNGGKDKLVTFTYTGCDQSTAMDNALHDAKAFPFEHSYIADLKRVPLDDDGVHYA